MSIMVADPVDFSIRQFSGAWRLMCGGAPGSRIESTDGIEYVFSGVPIPFFNVALITAHRISADALRSHARDASARAAKESVPWMLVLTHETLEPDVDAGMLLNDCDFGPLMPLTGMLAERVAASPAPPSGLELSAASDDAGCSEIVNVNGAAYGMDLSASHALIGTASFWADHFAVIGSVDRVPVSSAGVLMVDGYRYVALVATDPARRRRGYADAAMRRALEHAAAVYGERPTVLHATEAGRPVYERMGYGAISSHTLFMEKRFLPEH